MCNTIFFWSSLFVVIKYVKYLLKACNILFLVSHIRICQVLVMVLSLHYCTVLPERWLLMPSQA